MPSASGGVFGSSRRFKLRATLDATRSDQYVSPWQITNRLKPMSSDQRICETCGKPIWDLRRRHYCSDKCSELAARTEAEQQPVDDQQAEPKRKVKLCPSCGKPIKYWRNAYCDECLAAGSETEQPKQPVSSEPKVKNKGGRPTKATPTLFEAVLFDLARGFTREQACARNGCSHDQWEEWEKRPEFPTLRDRALAQRIDYLLNAMEEAQKNKRDWRMYSWQLERVRAYRDQFGDQAKIQINQQFNNGNRSPYFTQEELEEARKRLDEINLRQERFRAGVATNAELREHFIEKRDQFQHLIDCLDAGETPDQETQKQLYRLHDESSNRQQEPIRTVEGHVTVSHHVSGQLAIEDQIGPERESEPERPAPAPQDHSMRASDMDPLSGVAMPTEPPTPWRDRKPLAGPLSTRQRWLAEERVRKGGEGKRPW